MAPDAALTAMAHQQMPFTAELGLEVLAADGDGVRARAEWAPERCTAGGVLHGGYLMALCDSVGAMCAFFRLPEGATTSTIESKTNFLRAVTEGEITITSVPVHVGRSIIVVQTDVTRADGKPASRTTQTQAVITR